MAVWYKGFKCGGDAQRLLDTISRTVQNLGLGKYMVAARIGVFDGGQFYLFLGFNTPRGVVPPEVMTTLLQFEALRIPLPGDYAGGEITGVAASERKLGDAAGRVAYWQPVETEIINPFDWDEGGEEVGYGKDRSQRYDRLLQWLSAAGYGTWDRLVDTCRFLELDRTTRTCFAISRRLRLLGHLECSSDASRWYVPPPTLARLRAADDMGGLYALCGRRTSGVTNGLRVIGDVLVKPQKLGDGPPSVLLRPHDEDSIASKFSSLPGLYGAAVVDDAPQGLADLLPTLEGWKSQLLKVEGLMPDSYRVRRFSGDEFVEDYFSGSTGLYEFWRRDAGGNGQQRPHYTAFFDAGLGAWLSGEWYGLRFIAHQANGNVPCIRYEHNQQLLAVREGYRWPEPYERALVLSSGLLPERRAGWFVYSGIRTSVIEQLARKLNLDVEEDSANA